MEGTDALEFERLARAYAQGEVGWADVHKLAIEMEWRGTAQQVPRIMEDLYFVFLTADELDDPQFHRTRTEISAMIQDVDEARRREG